MKITMETDDVLALLEGHKAEHEAEFALQLEGWQREMEEYSDNMKAWANAGGFRKDEPKRPPKPDNYVREYDSLIDMIEKHILDTIELDDDDYKHIVKDEFGWKSHFTANSARYSSF